MNSTFPRILLGSLLLIFIYTSCQKINTTDLGSDLIPAVDNVNTFQAIFDVESNNFLFDDTSRVFYTQDHALGIIDNDPEFGKTRASIYFTLEPSLFGAYPFIKRDTVYIDSVVLSMSYKGLYGDSNSIQQFEVHEIDPAVTFKKDSTYPVNSPAFAVLPQVLGTKTVNFTTLNDSLRYAKVKDTVNTINELRIRLDTSFGRRFVNFDTTAEYKNDTIFKSKFKGFRLSVNEAASPLKNALAYFSINDNNKTFLTFHVRVVNNGKTDTIAPSFVYLVDPNANLIERTPGGQYLDYLNNGQPNDDKLYLQTSPGSYGLLRIPALDTFSNGVIHKAELILDKLPSAAENVLRPPAYLMLDAVSANGDSAFTIRNDFVPDPPSYDLAGFGGNYAGERYVFNMTRYVQSMVTKRLPNYNLRVYAPFMTHLYYMNPQGAVTSSKLTFVVNPFVSAGRVVVGGGSFAEPDKKLRLRIIYSRL